MLTNETYSNWIVDKYRVHAAICIYTKLYENYELSGSITDR